MKLIGKQKQKEYFDNLIESGNLGHFYIIEGAQGVGRKTMVDYISMKIHCRESAAPCFVCPSCIKHLTGNHPDYIKVKNQGDDKKTVSVDTIRKITEDIYVRPLISDRKIYVLDDEKPIGAEGQNAFLKVLEEPPSYAAIFLIVKDRSALLETVLSRGIICRVEPCSKADTVEFIKEKYPASSDMAEFIADYSGGVLGEAEKMAGEGEFISFRSEFYSALRKITESRAEGICEVLKFYTKNKEKVDIINNLFASWLRDAYYIKSTGDMNIINYDYKNNIYTFASGLSEAGIMDTLSGIFDTAKKFSKGNNLELWMCDVLSKLERQNR